MDTRVVTPEGIKTFEEIKEGDLVWSFEPQSGVMEKKKVLKKFIYYHNGEMVHLTSKKHDLFVTPEHRLLIKTRYDRTKFNWRYSESDYKKALELHKSGINLGRIAKILGLAYHRVWGWVVKGKKPRVLKSRSFEGGGFIQARETIGLQPFSRVGRLDRFYLPVTAKWDGKHEEKIRTNTFFDQSSLDNRYRKLPEEIPTDLLMQFCGWYISDGCTATIRTATGTSKAVFLYVDNVNTNEVINLLKKLNLNIHVVKKEKYSVISFISSALVALCDQIGHSAHEKHIPSWLLEYSPFHLKHLFDSLIKGDGTTSHGIKYYTVSQKLAEDVALLSIKLGFSPHITLRESRGGYIKKTNQFIKPPKCYTVSFRKEPKGIVVRRGNIKLEQYQGLVWCLEVEDNQNLLIERNGKFVFSGNSNYNEICRHTGLGLRELHEAMRPLILRLGDILSPPEGWAEEERGAWVMDFPLVMGKRSGFVSPEPPPGKSREDPGVEGDKLAEFPEVLSMALDIGWGFTTLFFLLGESSSNVAHAVERVEWRRTFRRGGIFQDRGRLTKGDWFEGVCWSALRPLADKYRFRLYRRPRIGMGDVDIIMPRLRTAVMCSFHIFPNKTMPSHAIDISRRIWMIPRYGFRRAELLLVCGSYFSEGFEDQLRTSLDMRGLRDVPFSVFEFGVWRPDEISGRLGDLGSWLDAQLSAQRARHPYIVEELEVELAEISSRFRVGPPYGPDPVERMMLLERRREILMEIAELRV